MNKDGVSDRGKGEEEVKQSSIFNLYSTVHVKTSTRENFRLLSSVRHIEHTTSSSPPHPDKQQSPTGNFH